MGNESMYKKLNITYELGSNFVNCSIRKVHNLYTISLLSIKYKEEMFQLKILLYIFFRNP